MTRRRHKQPYVDIVRDVGVSTPALERWALEIVGSGRSPTVQAAVYRDGDLAVSLAAGYQEPHGHATRASLYCWLSCTKLFSTLAMLLLHDRGYYDFEDRVAGHWPEFGANGKETITIRQALSHRAGIRLGPPGTSWGWWHDRAQVARWLVSLTPEWEPGTAAGYHNRVWGFLLDQLAWRWTGKGIDAVLRDEVCAPLGVHDFYLGIGEEQYRRLVKTAPARRDEARTAEARTDPQVAADPEFRPRIGDESNLFNAIEILRLPLAWGTAVATAEAAADLASVFALRGMHRGLRLCSTATFEQATRVQGAPGEIDRTAGVPRSWGLGVQLGLFPELPCSARILGHGGGSVAHVWADTEHRLSVAGVVSGTPTSAAAIARWRRELAEAVHQDLVA